MILVPASPESNWLDDSVIDDCRGSSLSMGSRLLDAERAGGQP